MNQGPYRKRARKTWKEVGFLPACRAYFQTRLFTLAEAQHVFGVSERTLEELWRNQPSDLNVVEEATTRLFTVLQFDTPSPRGTSPFTKAFVGEVIQIREANIAFRDALKKGEEG